MTTPLTICEGQVYARLNRADRAVVSIRVVEYRPGADRAVVVDADTGKRRREIAVGKLRPAGELSATVYRLVRDAEDGAR